MGRKTPGYRYPHATTSARKHDCRYCSVVGVLAQRVADGHEQWGTPHVLGPFASETQAQDIKNGLYRGRDCRTVTAISGKLSVSVKFRADDGTEHLRAVRASGGYVLVLRAWTRAAGMTNVAGREGPLHYNPLRRR